MERQLRRQLPQLVDRGEKRVQGEAGSAKPSLGFAGGAAAGTVDGKNDR